MPIWCSTEICHKVAFSDIHNKEYPKATIKALRNNDLPKFSKTSKQRDRHCCGILDVKFGQVAQQYF